MADDIVQEVEPDPPAEAAEAVTCPGDAYWAQLFDAFINKEPTWFSMLRKIVESSESYRKWLEEMLGVVKVEQHGYWTKLPDGETPLEGKIGLHRLQGDFSRKWALKAVTPESLQQKMEAFLVAGAYRLHSPVNKDIFGDSKYIVICFAASPVPMY